MNSPNLHPLRCYKYTAHKVVSKIRTDARGDPSVSAAIFRANLIIFPTVEALATALDASHHSSTDGDARFCDSLNDGAHEWKNE